METTFQDRLESLRNEFATAGKDFPDFKLDLLTDYSRRPLTYQGWEAIKAKSKVGPPDTQWDHFPDGQFLARFHGNLKGDTKFQKLAAAAYGLFCDTDPQLVKKETYFGWLRIIYDIASNCPTIGVHYDTRFWEHDGPADLQAIASVSDLRWTHNGMNLPCHPLQLAFDGCLFSISAAVLQMFLTPRKTDFLEDSPFKFRLVPWQLAAVFANTVMLERPVKEIAASGIREVASRMLSLADRLDVPWFIEGANDSGELRLAFQTLYQVKARSTGLFPILREFEKRGWPQSIDNPIGTDASAAKAGRDFVIKLNKGQTQIKFKAINSGRVITWEPIRQKTRLSRNSSSRIKGTTKGHLPPALHSLRHPRLHYPIVQFRAAKSRRGSVVLLSWPLYTILYCEHQVTPVCE